MHDGLILWQTLWVNISEKDTHLWRNMLHVDPISLCLLSPKSLISTFCPPPCCFTSTVAHTAYRGRGIGGIGSPWIAGLCPPTRKDRRDRQPLPEQQCWGCGDPVVIVKCCLMSSDVSWHIRDKLWPVPKHGSINLYVHGNQKAR